MRRIPRPRQPSAVLTQCLQMTAASQHAAMSRAAAATTNSTTTATCLARPRDFSTTPGRPFHTSRPWAKEQEPPATKVQEADGPSVAAKAEVEVEPKEPLPQDLESELVANNEDYERDPALYEDVAEEAVEDIHTDLVIPPPRHDDNIAPKPHDLEQGGVVDYTPAQSADGLEVVGGLSGWFKNDKHIPKSKLEAFERFAPEEQVLDQSVLEFCVRRAVIEATVLISGPGDTDLLLRSWGGRSNAEAAKRVQALNVKVNKKGGPKLVGDQDLARVVVADLAAQDEASSDTQVSYPSPEEARKLCAEFDGSWKKISLENAQFRFAITKRIYQLTGHRIPDAKLIGVNNVGELLALVVTPPPARTVYEAILQVGQLTELPNVEVYPTRRTPITEAQKVGRWKVIKDILEKKGLPVTGDGGVGKFVEDEWYRGPRVFRKKGKKRA